MIVINKKKNKTQHGKPPKLRKKEFDKTAPKESNLKKHASLKAFRKGKKSLVHVEK